MLVKRKTKKKKVRKGNFIKRLQARPKIKSIRRRIKEAKSKSKKLSGEYKRALKSESRKMK